MTEEQIERAVEAKIDRLDKRFIHPMTQEEYDAAMAEIRRWEENEMRFCEKPRE